MGSAQQTHSWAPRFGTDHLREYRNCDRCGFTYPKDMLISQDGLLVCEKCLFEPHPGGRKHR